MGDTAINPNSSNPSVNFGSDHEDQGPSTPQTPAATPKDPGSTHPSFLDYVGFFFHHASGGEQKKLAMKMAQGEDISPEDLQKADKLQQIGEKAVQVQANGIALFAAAQPSGGPIVGETAANLVVGKVVDSATDPAGAFPGGEADHKETTGTKPADTPPPNLPATPPQTTTPTTPAGSSNPSTNNIKPVDDKVKDEIWRQLYKSYEPKKPEPPKPPEPMKKGKIEVNWSEPDPAPKKSGTNTK